MTNDISTVLSGAAALPAATSRPHSPVSSESPAAALPAVAVGKVLPSDAQPAAAKEAELAQVVKDLNSYAQAVQREVQFSIDKDSGQMLIKVIDSKTKELIRQMPTEEALAIDRYLDRDYGLMLRAKA